VKECNRGLRFKDKNAQNGYMKGDHCRRRELMVFSTTSNNISVISWQSVL